MDLASLREKIQEDIIAYTDGMDQTTVTELCQIVVDNFNLYESLNSADKSKSFRMEVLNKQESTVTEVTYTLQDNTSEFYYKEWLNDSGKVIDCILRDKDGNEIDDAVLLEKVQVYIDSLA